MPRFGDTIETLLKRQDMAMEEVRQAAGMNTPYAPVWQSADARELVREMNEFGLREDVYQAWLKTGSKDSDFNTISARFGKFDVIPIEAMFAFATTTQSIPDSTVTDLSFNLERNSNFFVLDEDDTKIAMSATDSRTIGIIGTIHWTNNATGRRYIKVSFYDEADALLFSLELHNLKSTGLDTDVMPIAGFQSMPFVTVFPKYLKFRCQQTSGGALDMTRCTIALFLMS